MTTANFYVLAKPLQPDQDRCAFAMRGSENALLFQQPLNCSQSQGIEVKYAKEGMQLRQHRTGEEKGIEPYDNH
jgi:hypothetical protein